MANFWLDKTDYKEIVTVTFTLFAVIDVLGSLPVIISIKKKMGDINAALATLVSGGLMLLFFLVGEQMLQFMGLDIHSFAIAGSIVIFILGMEMVLGLDIFKHDDNMKASTLVPVAFPLIAGSGTLTTVMSLKAAYEYYNIFIAILINLIIVYITLRSVNVIERALGPSGVAVIRKFFGVILLAIAVKIFRGNLGVMHG
jgi:multiple antibiotic resistance protein